MHQRLQDRQDDRQAADVESLYDKRAREQRHEGASVAGCWKPLQPRRQEQRLASGRRHSFTSLEPRFWAFYAPAATSSVRRGGRAKREIVWRSEASVQAARVSASISGR